MTEDVGLREEIEGEGDTTTCLEKGFERWTTVVTMGEDDVKI